MFQGKSSSIRLIGWLAILASTLQEVGFWIDPVQFRSSNQAIHRGGTFASGVGSGKQKVLPAQGDTTQSTFGRVVVDFQVAIGAIPEQMESSGQARNGWRRQVPISWTPS